jgi:RNA polymerase sigma factor (sigma-70 family)
VKTSNRRTSAANAYLNEIGREPLLTADQEIDLGRKVQRAQELKRMERPLTAAERREVAIGDKAERTFVKSNLRLVVNCAKKYGPVTKSFDLMDLIQEGNVGLITAVRRYDPTKGFRFSTFAYWWIRQGITRAIITRDRAIHMPIKISEMAANWSSKSQKLAVKLGRQPTTAELAEVFGVSERDVLLYMERGQTPMSLDTTLLYDGGMTLVDMVTDSVAGEGPLDHMMLEEEKDVVMGALLTLTPKEQDIIRRRLGLEGHTEATLASIGKLHGVSRERIRQVFESSTRRLRMQILRAQEERELQRA